MLYLVYLDEFGHIGPYLSANDPKHKTHPIFGLGGVVIPYHKVRAFSTFFFQLKNNLLKFELEQSGVPAPKWEKKGASLYTVKNVQKYRELRVATNRLLNEIERIGGYCIHVGIEKERTVDNHDSKGLYHRVLIEVIKRLDQQCKQGRRRRDQFMLILDQQEENVMRGEIVETASIEMFGKDRTSLIEPPLQVESHLYQTVQCADWLCGMFGRLTYFQCEPAAKPEYDVFEKYFGARLKQVSLRSGVKKGSSPA